MIPGFLSYFALTIHVLACILLVVIVLLQAGKGADMGAIFGGGSQTLFGSGGAGNFLTRATWVTAVVLLCTLLFLTYGQSRTATSNLLQRLPAPAAAPSAPAPEAAAPEAPAPAAPAPEAGTPPAGAPAEAPAGEGAPSN